MSWPMPFASFGVFIPGAFFSGKAKNEDVRPTIPVEIVGEGKKVLRVYVGVVSSDRFLGVGRVLWLIFERSRRIFVSSCEAGAFPPIRAGHNVVLTVLIEVTKVCALRPKFAAQLFSFELMNFVI